MGSRQFCRGREVEAEARQGSNVLNRGRELEAEVRQTKFEFEARQRRPLKKTLLPLDV